MSCLLSQDVVSCFIGQTVIASCMGCTNIWDISLFWEFACVEMSLFYLSHLIESYIWNNFPSVFNGVALLLSFSVLIKKFDAVFIFSPLFEICFFLAVCGILLYPQLWNFMMACLGIELLLSFVVGRMGESFWSGSQHPLVLEHFMESSLSIPPCSLWRLPSSHFQKCAFALMCPWPPPAEDAVVQGPQWTALFPCCLRGAGAGSAVVGGALRGWQLLQWTPQEPWRPPHQPCPRLCTRELVGCFGCQLRYYCSAFFTYWLSVRLSLVWVTCQCMFVLEIYVPF